MRRRCKVPKQLEDEKIGLQPEKARLGAVQDEKIGLQPVKARLGAVQDEKIGLQHVKARLSLGYSIKKDHHESDLSALSNQLSRQSPVLRSRLTSRDQ